MKLVTVDLGEHITWGILEATEGAEDLFIPVRGDVLADWPELAQFAASGRLPRLSDCLDRRDAIPVTEVTFLPPIPNPAKIICVGLNYAAHVEEMGRARAGHPTLFTRFADAQVGHMAALAMPANSEKFDFEGELAVVIGSACKNVAPEKALDHVLGYACFMDGSVRDWQRHTTQFTPGKNFVASGAFGPWIITADDIPDPQKLRLRTRLNGETVQDGLTSDMIFPVAEVISYCSQFTTLNAGDVIATGTPPGVGFAREPQLFMKPGDVIEVEIEGIGTLRNPIR